ncbi:unnamed protein product [Didymodactylos carnosus]|uniref:Uncharacterized protein n=1 Tax=Didymodactylos carnosus TaxID=1234261 RepID=A0A8S2SBV4_9BILA|nr:unnamed protein product [Didymodactylos carnosus]CAF4211571.1 unnamed protein product [Didymodactylos carnosus]
MINTLTGPQLTQFRAQNNIHQHKCCRNKIKRLTRKPPSSSFKTRQSFVKALTKVTSSLPKCDLKKKAVVQHLAQEFGLISKPTHQRSSLQLSDKLKKVVHSFYIQDDISYQLPGKGDTIVVKDDLGNITTSRKRILFYNLCENYELFKEENKNINLNRSTFAVLRPPFVVPKAYLAHRICVYLYQKMFIFF